MYRWFKKWFLDGWLTTGDQIGVQPGETRVFSVCVLCHRVFPHWLASMTAAEAKHRGYIGCQCGSLRITPAIIPSWQSTWWYLVRGYLIRKLIFRSRLWDPRMPLLYKDLT